MQFLKNYFLVLLVSAIALAVPLWALNDNFLEQEKFIEKEIEGTKLLKAIVPLVKSIPEHRGYSKSNMLAGRYSVELDLTKLRLSKEMETVIQAFDDSELDVPSESLLMLRNDLEAVLEIPTYSTDAPGLWEEASELFEAHNTLMNDLELLIREIADKSNLILDPALNTYYLMDLAVNRFPLIINEMGKTRGYLVGLKSKIKPSSQDYLYLENLYSHTRFLLSSLERSLAQASLHSDVQFVLLTENLDRFVERYGRYTKNYSKKILGVDAEPLPQISFASLSILINQLHEEFDTALGLLNELLNQRLTTKRQEHVEAITATLLISFLLVSLVFVLFYKILSRQQSARFKAESAAEIALRDLSEKNAKQQQLFAIIGHELRTPAAAIKMVLDQEHDYLKGMHNSDTLYGTVDHLLDVLDDMRTVIQPDSATFGEVEVVSLHKTIQRSVIHHERLTQDSSLRVHLKLEQVPDQMVRLNARLLRQIIVNMIKNCALHAEAHSLVIEFCATEGQPNQFCISFEDDGVGIAEEYREHLFDAFARGETHADGTGLGLHLSRKFAREQLGGDLVFEEGKFGGARFILTLQAEPVPEQEIEQVEEGVTPASLRNMHVLFAEDNKVIAELTKMQLKKAGARVVHAENGIAAMREMRDQLFDLVLTDFFMPEMNGDELIRRLRNTDYHGPIVAVTAAGVGDEMHALKQAGADFVLAKPLLIDDLQKILAGFEPDKNKKDNALTQQLKRDAQMDDVAWDEDALLETYGDDGDMVTSLVQLYIKESQNLLTDLKAAIDAQVSHDIIRTKSHAFKGQAASMFLEDVRIKALHLEDAAREGQLDVFEPLLQELIAEHEKVMHLFRERFDISVLEDSYA
jgi:signal transduction histidine kinase/response regulator of citrate/malate metabolism